MATTEQIHQHIQVVLDGKHAAIVSKDSGASIRESAKPPQRYLCACGLTVCQSSNLKARCLRG